MVGELTSQNEECYDEILYKVMQVFVVTLLAFFLVYLLYLKKIMQPVDLAQSQEIVDDTGNLTHLLLCAP